MLRMTCHTLHQSGHQATHGMHVDLVKLDSLLSKDSSVTVQWNHVRGHRGIEGNEEADRLARAGAKEYKQKPGTSGFG